MVRSFLNGSHFAFYVSDKVFSPVRLGCGRQRGQHRLVEMLVDANSDQTADGNARVHKFKQHPQPERRHSGSTDNTLEILRLVSQQLCNVAADPNGSRWTTWRFGNARC